MRYVIEGGTTERKLINELACLWQSVVFFFLLPFAN